tara:strand:- start:450 stop:1391 length:942 start_codon:yes stop_codon:yes gene_type:complete
MNFLSFFILIFKKNLSPNFFLFFVMMSIVFLLLLSFTLNIMDLTINANTAVKKYQFTKLEKSSGDIQTILLGDSSGGNSVVASYFEKYSGKRTESFYLTGSYGIIGSYGILKKVYSKNNQLKNVIIIHTQDIWSRSFPIEASIQLQNYSSAIKEIGINQYLGYFFNFKEISWHLKYFLKEKKIKNVFHDDYIIQDQKKYSNRKLIYNNNFTLNNIKINYDKISELDLLQDFCINKRLNCIFVHGPLHEDYAKNSKLFSKIFEKEILPKFRIQYLENIFSYPNYMMGDTMEHVDPNFKETVTKNYYDLLKDKLI